MKGSAQFIAALLVMVMIAVIFAIDKNVIYSRHVNIVSSSTKIYSLENSAESLKRSLDSAIYFSGQRALKEVFEAGGQWEPQRPSEFDIHDSVRQKFFEKLERFSPDVISGHSISWSRPRVFVNLYDDKIRISGERKFTIRNSGAAEISIEVPAEFEREIKTNALKVFRAGRVLLDSERWSISGDVIDSESIECGEKVEGILPRGSSYEIDNSQNLIALVVLCGYSDEAGAFAEQTYNKEAVGERISSALGKLAAAQKIKTGFDYAFSHELSSAQEGGKEKITAIISVSIKDQNSKVPGPQGFAPLELKFSVPVEFEMAAPAEAAE